MFKLCTNKNHSYKQNEQINSQNIDNSECFGVKFVKIYPDFTIILFYSILFYMHILMSDLKAH
jgi:hypothetical protein